MRALTPLLLGMGSALAAGSGDLGVKLHASATDAGDAQGQCGSATSSIGVNDRVEVCIGFEAVDARNAGGLGSKAVFYPRVDEYSSIAVNTCEQHTTYQYPPTDSHA